MDPSIPLVISWDEVTAFPFNSQAAPVNDYETLDPNSTYTIIGLHRNSPTTSYKLRQPLVGTFPDNPTYYYAVDEDGDVVQDVFLQDIVIDSDALTETFPVAKPSVNETYGPLYAFSGYYIINNSGNFKIAQTQQGGTYGLTDLNGVPVLNPGTNNETNVTVSWDGVEAFPFKTTAIGYGVIVYNIVGAVPSSTDPTDYYALQRVVNDVPVENSYIIVDYDEVPLEFNSVQVVTSIVPTSVFPYTSALNPADPFTLYRVISKYIITKSPYKIKTTDVVGEYALVDLEGTAITDPGTNDTTPILVMWDGIKEFPFNTRSDSNYEAFIYTVIGTYIVPRDITTSATGPITTSDDEQFISDEPYELSTQYNRTPYIGVTGPTGPYTGPTLVTVPAGTGASGPTITNTVNGAVTAIFGGTDRMGIETTTTDWSILYIRN
jgi:hypothetical protein